MDEGQGREQRGCQGDIAGPELNNERGKRQLVMDREGELGGSGQGKGERRGRE